MECDPDLTLDLFVLITATLYVLITIVRSRFHTRFGHDNCEMVSTEN